MILREAETERRVAARRAVAVVVSRFPKITETFVLREISEIERQGQAVRLVTLIRERASVFHPAAEPWLGRLLHVPFVSAEVAGANWRRWRRDGSRCARLLGRIVAATWRRPAVALRSLLVLAQAIAVAERLEAERVGHVHAQFATYPATAAWVIGELTGIGFSFTVHAHDLFVHQLLLREKIAAALFVRTISEFNRGRLLELAPEAGEKIVVVRVGVDSRQQPAPQHADRLEPEAAARGEAPVILSVASLEEYKGLEVLVAACAILRAQGLDFSCRIIGGGPLRERLGRRIRERGLADRVLLMGARTEAEVAAWMRRAAVVVQPSVVARDGQMEGIPVALMEALRWCRPVVASRLSGIPELIADGVHGLLVPPGEPRALAAALRRQLEGAEAAAEMARRGEQRVRDEFDLELNTGRLLERFDAVMEEMDLGPLLAAAGARERVSVRFEQRRTDSAVRGLRFSTASGPREAVLKRHLHRAGESAPPDVRARRELRLLEQIGRSRSPVLRVPEVLAADPERGELLLAACRGEPLQDLVRRERGRGGEAAHEALRGAGAWLAAFHALSGNGGALGRLETMLDEIEHDLLRRAALSLPEAERCLARSGRLAEAFAGTSPRLVTVHGDFWPGNVFTSPGSVEVIDFEGARPGLAEEDLANFLVELRLCFLRPGTWRAYSGCATALLRGYGGAAAAGLELCAAHAALRLLCSGPPPGLAGWKQRWRRRVLARTAAAGGVLP